VFGYLIQIDVVADIILTMASFTVIIDAVEIIFKRGQYGPGGIYDYAVLGTQRKSMRGGRIAPILDILFNYPLFIYLIVIQALAAALIVSHIFRILSLPITELLVGIVLLIHLLSHFRNQYGLDGSDKMQVIIFAGLFIFNISPDLLVKQFSIFFICFQVLLAYFTSGFAKLISPIWRSGKAVTAIVNTMTYGNKFLASFLFKYSALSKILCWSIIVFECGFPIFVFTGTQTTIIFMAIGVVFHFFISIFMRLNSFFWTFVSTYPAILFFAYNFQKFVSGSSS
jgi:hypothetical protein